MNLAPSPPTANTAELRAAAIVGVEEQVAMLRRLSMLGMRLADEVCDRAINSPYHPEPVHEPARAFAAVSRAVRLTLVLQAKVEAELLALRNGDAIPIDCRNRAHSKRSGVAGLAASNDAIADDDLDDAAPDTLDRARETLCEREGERFDEFLSRPFDDCVAAIRSDLGLAAEGDGALDTADGPSSPDCAMPTDETPVPLGQMFGLRAHDPPHSG